MDLGKHVVDKEILDREGWRAGKVDDLVLEVPDAHADAPAGLPEVVAIVSGPLSLSTTLGGPLQWLARRMYRFLGIADPQPIEIPWDKVTKIDVVVHVDVNRDEVGLTALAAGVDRRFIRHIPGA